MSIIAKGPPYMTEDEALYYKGFGVYNPPLPEVEKRHGEALAKLLKQETVWKKIDAEQAARDWWLDNEFLDGTTVREVLSGEKTLHTDSDSDEYDDDEDDGDALADLLHHKAPWEKKHQIGGTHYSDMAVQPWDAMRAWMSPGEYIGYHVGTIIGYLSRHKAKGSEQDLHKAGHHMDELRRYLKEDEEYPW